MSPRTFFFFFFFNDTATTEIYTLSLHDALPIYRTGNGLWAALARTTAGLNILNLTPVWILDGGQAVAALDRKSTRLNSSHGYISYAVFCLKKKKRVTNYRRMTS